MERFKQALKAAIGNSAAKISIVENVELETVTSDGSSSKLMELPPADTGWIESLIAFLFQGEQSNIEAGKPTQGTLNIPGVGLLKAIATRTNNITSISLYFPNSGDEFFTQDWTLLNSVSQDMSMDMANSEHSTADTFPTNVDQLAAEPSEESHQDSHQPVENHSDEDAAHVDMFAMPSNTQVDSNAVSEVSASSEESSMPDDGGMFIPGGADMFSEPDSNNQKDHEDNSPSSDMFSQPQVSEQPVTEESSESNMFAISTAQPEVSSPAPNVNEKANAPSNHSVSKNHLSSESNAMSSNNPEPQIIFGNNDPAMTIVRDRHFPIDDVLKTMMSHNASDMHLTMGQPIIFRIDGDLQRQGQTPLTEQVMEQLLLPIMPRANRQEFAEIYDTDFAYELPDVGRFRVNMFKDNYGVGAVLRQIPAEVLTADQLKLPDAIRSFCGLHKGLVLVTGPTGSGKSTTLAAMIDLINKTRPEHILTIEDPIEFVHSQQKCLVNQREVGKHTDSFKRALKAALREDPDIVLIGELRDLETIHIALETAETGHLVFGTLHTNTAVSTIDRIIDQFPADQQSQMRTMVAASLKGVVAQTLIKKKGGGRCAAHEILVPNDAVANMIRESKNHMIENHMQTQKQDGNMLLNESLIKLVVADQVDVKDAYFKSLDKASFLDLARRNQVDVSFLNTLDDGKKAS